MKIPHNVFPHRVWLQASKLLESNEGLLKDMAEAAGVLDVCMGLAPYNGLIVGAALSAVLAEMNGQQQIANFSATKFMETKKNFEEIGAGGFDTFEDVIHADLLLISELSYVPASVAADLDSLIYRRFCTGKQTIVSGYNMPVESGFTAETIDGFGGYPLLAKRLHETVIVFAPELPDECFR